MDTQQAKPAAKRKRAKPESKPEPIMAYKGFDKDWTCRGYQFALGETYTHEGKVEACESGFHACENPLDVFKYYNPGESRFALVEQSGDIARHSDDSKVASARIEIKAELTIPGIVSAAFAYVKSKCVPADSEHATGDRSASSATGYRSASSATGDRSASLTTGAYSSSQIIARDDGKPQHAAAISTGFKGRVKAPDGCALFLVERNNDGEITHTWAGIAGRNGIKRDVFYTLVNGQPQEAP